MNGLIVKKELTGEDRLRLKEWSSLLVIKCFEKVGLDIVYDGEQQRTEMYQEPVSFIEGFHFYGEEFALELAKTVIRPNIEALVRAGATMIQIDEPAATTRPDEIDIFVQSFNESCRGINCRFNLHICFSDYSLLYPAVLGLENCCQFTFTLKGEERGGGWHAR